MKTPRSLFATQFRRGAGWVERHPGWMRGWLLLVYAPCVLLASRNTPLSHDELYTGYLSGAPTLPALWADVRGFDLNPPLSYWLTRLTLPLDGAGALGLRLPEMVAFFVFLQATFTAVRRRLGAAYGVFAATLLMGSMLWDLAFLARPYALLLAGFALALVAWQRLADGLADRSRRRWALAGLAAAELLGLLSHVFGVLGVLALLLGELWRARLRRRVGLRADWPVLLAMALPLLAVAVYLPLLRTHGEALYPPAFQPDGTMIFEFYTGSVERELVTLGLTGLVVLLVLGAAHLRGGAGVPARRRSWYFFAPEWATITALLGLPLLLMTDLMRTHGAFFARYGATANVGVALVATALLARWTQSGAAGVQEDELRGAAAHGWPVETASARPDPRAAWLGTAVVLLTSGLAAAWPQALAAGVLWPTRAHTEPAVLLCASCQRTAASGLPLVDASGLTFVQMTHYERDRTMRRVFYLTDPDGSREFAHANIFERMGELVQHFHLRGQVEPYAAFLRENPHFYVLGRYSYPEDWLLRKLVADGAEVRMLGEVHDSYRDTELWEVRVNPRPGR